MGRLVVVVVATGLLLARPARSEPESSREVTGGFRLGSAPRIETVFGDTAQFKRTIDRFLQVHAEMQRTHEDFSRNVQATLGSLAAHRATGGNRCPLDAVAVTYARAFRLGQLYHSSGGELEALHASIRNLDDLGETRGLTPDYRWKVARALKLHGQVLADFREMRVSFETQLADELRFHGCDPGAVIAKGEELERAGVPPPPPPELPRADARPPRRGGKEVRPAPPVQASNATFVVDNGSCPGTLRVYLDGALLGEVGSNAKAAFRAPVGRHDLCLIPAASTQRCGDTGTIRRAYVHDGWSIALRCD